MALVRYEAERESQGVRWGRVDFDLPRFVKELGLLEQAADLFDMVPVVQEDVVVSAAAWR